jgi:hypothetical protein
MAERWALAEYHALRTEINGRSAAQRAILVVQTLAITALAAITVIHPPFRSVLLLVGPASFFLLLQWFDHHRAIQRSGAYIRYEVEPGLRGGWERSQERTRYGPEDGALWAFWWSLPMFLLFPGAILAAALCLGLAFAPPTLSETIANAITNYVAFGICFGCVVRSYFRPLNLHTPATPPTSPSSVFR